MFDTFKTYVTDICPLPCVSFEIESFRKEMMTLKWGFYLVVSPCSKPESSLYVGSRTNLRFYINKKDKLYPLSIWIMPLVQVSPLYQSWNIWQTINVYWSQLSQALCHRRATVIAFFRNSHAVLWSHTYGRGSAVRPGPWVSSAIYIHSPTLILWPVPQGQRVLIHHLSAFSHNSS